MAEDEYVDKVPSVVETTEFRTLPCPLSQADMAMKGYELAVLITQLDQEHLEEGERRRQYDELIEAGRAKVEDLTAILASGSMERGVECRISLNYEVGEVTVTRLDLDVVIERRHMTEDEKERELPFEEPGTVQ